MYLKMIESFMHFTNDAKMSHTYKHKHTHTKMGTTKKKNRFCLFCYEFIETKLGHKLSETAYHRSTLISMQTAFSF